MATSGEGWQNPPEDEEKDMKEIFVKNGVSGLKKYMDKWKTVPLNVAITGNAGTGKSSFINSARGLTADDEGAAAVGVVETTTKPEEYNDPNHKNLVYWDLPGVGTPNFPRETYLKKVKFDRYDFFLIFCSCRFTENDIWLAKEVNSRKKKFYLIRTNIGTDIDNDKRTKGSNHDRSNVLDIIKEDCNKNLKLAAVPSDHVYLIDNYQTDDFDFGTLLVHLIEDLPDLKREAMTLSLSVLTTEVIEVKKKTLQKRIWKIAAISAAAGAVPVPGVGEAADALIMLEEAIFYRNQLGVNDANLKREAERLNMDVGKLKKDLKLATTALSFTVKGISKLCVQLGASAAVENTVKFGLPILGSVIAAGVSYGVTVVCLRNLLNTVANDALEINNAVIRHQVTNANT